MRMIGHVESEALARRFSDYLYLQGITSNTEPDGGSGWSIWVHDEEQLDRARAMLDAYRRSPDSPEYQVSEAAEKRRQQDSAQDEAARKRYFDREKLIPQRGRFGPGPLTFLLLAACVVVALGTRLEGSGGLIERLIISHFRTGFPEVRSGELWRLITPIFLHFGIAHIFFNMMWLVDLGSMIEGRKGTWRFALLVLSLAVASNVGQYLQGGPLFGGMSGVNYGLIGFVWMRGKFDPASGMFLTSQEVFLALFWFVLCFTGQVGPIANTAHAVGLGLGMAIGYTTAIWAQRR